MTVSYTARGRAVAQCKGRNTGPSMAKKIVTEADRKRTPAPQALEGYSTPRSGGGQRISLERGVATRNKKNPGKRPHQGG
jgi:hypothetical protein